MSKSKIIEISGGYHNVPAMRVRVPADAVIRDGVDLEAILSQVVFARVQRHCCGVSGCTCGGMSRCDIECLP